MICRASTPATCSSGCAPTMTKPLTMSWLPSPLAPLTNCARPTVPPAPAMLVTCTLSTSFSAISACCIERAVWSQPPPGAAGAMILSSSCCDSAGERPQGSARRPRRRGACETGSFGGPPGYAGRRLSIIRHAVSFGRISAGKNLLGVQKDLRLLPCFAATRDRANGNPAVTRLKAPVRCVGTGFPCRHFEQRAAFIRSTLASFVPRLDGNGDAC